MVGSFSFAENNYIQIEPFSEHLAAVQNEDELWGYIDQTGELVIPCEWERAGAFTDGIVETAKVNNLDVRKYFEFILKKLPLAEGNLTDEFLESIMPWGAEAQEKCQRSCI